MAVELLALLLAGLAGLLMALQGTLNSALGKVIGQMGSTFMVHIIGLIAVTIVIFSVKTDFVGFNKVLSAPWYTYLGGLLSVGIIYTVATSIAAVGATAATTAIIVGQVSTAALLDQFGLLGLDKVEFTGFKVLGIGLLAAGTWLLLKR